MLPLLIQCYANKQIFTCDGHKKVKKNKQGKFTLLANKYWVVEISMSSEQHVGTYKHYNIMNTNYTKIHTRFFNDFIWCNQFGKRGYAYAMK